MNDPLSEPSGECLAKTRHPGFSLRAALSRPAITILAVVLLGVLTWSGWRGVQNFKRQPRSWTWRISLRLLGWWPVAASAVLAALALLSDA